jgi:hypothetical protein
MTKDDDTTINAVSNRAPEFYPSDPQTWFGMLDAQYAMRTPPITASLVKFYHALSGLPPSVLIHIKPIIREPKGDPYERMRLKLVATYQKSDLDKSYELLAIRGIGSKKPSEAIALVEELWNEKALKLAIILRMLPPEIAAGLDGDEASSPEELGAKADRILARQTARKDQGKESGVGNGISAVNAIEALQAEISAIKGKRDFKKTDTFEGGLCFVHRKYGKDAYSCRGAPCTLVNSTKPRPAGNANANHK